MKMRLLRGAWRLLVAIKDGLALLVLLLFFGALFAILSARPNPTIAHDGALLLDLNGSIVEQPADTAPLALLTDSGRSMTREYRLRDLIRAAQTAASDSRVKAVVLDLDGFSGGGQAAIDEFGRALDSVRRAGKPVLAFATAYSDDSYALAAHASEIWLNPMGAVLLTGPGSSHLYYKGLLDKLGVDVRVYRVGQFKSAVEPFTRTDQSPAAKLAAQALVDSLWTSWRQQLSAARPQAQIDGYVGNMTARVAAAGGDLARAAAQAGLIDRLGNRYSFGRRVAALVGGDSDRGPGGFKTIRLDRWLAANPASDNGAAIGVVTVAGDIVDGEAPTGTAGGETISRLIGKALAKDDLKALVVRVDSPGGSVTASEQIRDAIFEARRRGLPVVVSMGSVAASGGYWVSTAAQRIYAEPSTITGSIGVFGLLPTFEKTLAKAGLGADGVKSTPLSGEPDMLRGPTPQVEQLMQLGVNDIYRRFTTLVGQARGLPVTQVDAIGQGRVWAGNTARGLGLVDAYGGLDDAVAAAARLARLDPKNVHAEYIERSPSFPLQLLADLARDKGDGGSATDPFGALAGRPNALLAQALGDAARIADGPAIQVRCLDCGPSDNPRPAVAGGIVALLLARLGLS
jgi:protease-4